jgi:hypothetical protein
MKTPASSLPGATRRQEGHGASAKMWPNPSIEGMPKRLRLLRTPHVKR